MNYWVIGVALVVV